MLDPMIIWYAVVGCVLIICTSAFVKYIMRHHHYDSRHLNAHHIFSIGRERDLLFIPGDRCEMDREDEEVLNDDDD